MVIFGLVVLFIPSAPLGQPAGAQTATPTPATTGPRIQFLNPSGTTANSGTSGPGREVSANDDGSGFGYHLVAWVGNMPPNPEVEFKYQGTNSGDTEVSIQRTSTVRGTDTFDAFWGLGGIADGTYTLKAILYSNGVEVGQRDNETVIVNNADAPRQGQGPAMVPTGEDRGETVEITYPAQAGLWGAFRKPGTNNPYAGVVDVQASAGTNNVRAFYTTSAPGTEPAWTRCSSPEAGETLANSADGVRCTLAAGVSPTAVTAIAAAAGDANQSVDAGTCVPPTPPSTTSPCGEAEDSGDAHRATGYVQNPSSLTVAPSAQRQDDKDAAAAENQYTCSDVIAGTILDQFQRKVAGANADVTAAGPTDNLYFDDPDTAGNYQAPDRGNHANEATVNCEDATKTPRDFNTTANQAQGEHEVAGEGDFKHVESTPAGTNDAGQIRFQLYNRSTTVGTTQFTVYYDRDDDDLMCSAEPRASGTIGWGTDPVGASTFADDTTVCSEPTASPTGSSTASPTASSTARPTSTASSSASPTSSSSPGTTRTITFIASDSQVEAGDEVTFSGRIFSSNTSCTDNEFVQIQRRIHGTTEFADFTSSQSASDGSFEVTAIASQNADYQAVSPGHDNCATSTSDTATVLVKVKVSVKVNEFRPQRGDTVVFTGKVTPNHKGTKVVLQRKKGGRWVKVAADGLGKRSNYRFSIPADWRRGRVFRVLWKSSDSDHESGRSQNVKVTTRR
jgi:hypothetical protein